MANGNFAGGSGSFLEPYLIEDELDYMQIYEMPDKHFKLLSDIYLFKTTAIPVDGLTMPYFSGCLDGNGRTVFGMRLVNKPFISNHQGIIRNINFEDIYRFNSVANSGIITHLRGGLLEKVTISGICESTTTMSGVFINTIHTGVIQNCFLDVSFIGNSSHQIDIVSTMNSPSPSDSIIRNCGFVLNGSFATTARALRTLTSGTVINTFYNMNISTCTNMTYKTLEQMKTAETYSEWNDLERVGYPTWVKYDGSYPVLWFNDDNKYLIKTICGKYLYFDNGKFNIIDEESTEDEKFFKYGMSGAIVGLIPNNQWNSLRVYREFDVIVMSNEKSITHSNRVFNTELVTQTSTGFIYKSNLTLDSIDGSLTNISIKKEDL